MNIKHFSGYGTVEAKKIASNYKPETEQKTIHIRVKGNHECGIIREDSYDIANWLLSKFDKVEFPKNNIKSEKIKTYRIEPGCEDGTETCDYYVTYATNIKIPSYITNQKK